MEQTIVRYDGVVYKRNAKQQYLDATINMRYNSSKLEKLKKIAKDKKTNYQTMIRNTIDKYILEENSYENKMQ